MEKKYLAPSDYRTQSFVDIFKKLKDNEVLRTNNKEAKKYIESKGFQYDDYVRNAEEFTALIKGKSDDEIEDILAPDNFGLGFAGRVSGRFLSGLADFGETVYTGGMALSPTITWEESQELVDSYQDKAKSFLPDNVRRQFQRSFDPYHGEGLSALAEDFGALALEFAGGRKVIKDSLEAVSKNFVRDGTTSGGKSVFNNFKNKVGSNKSDISKMAGEGILAATVLTLTEDPSETTEFGADVLEFSLQAIGKDPQASAALKRLRETPDDDLSANYLNSYLVNLGLAPIFGAASGLILGAGKGGVQLSKPFTGKAMQELKRLPSFLPASFAFNFTTRRGTNDEIIDLMIRRDAIPANVAEMLKGRSDDLKALVNMNIPKEKKDEVEEIIGMIWNTSSKSPEYKQLLDKIGDKDIAKVVKEMDQEFRDLEKMKNLTRGELQATVNANGDTYVTRNYELFDYGKYQKNILKKWNTFRDTYLENDGNLYSRGMGTADPDGFFKNIVSSLVATGRTEKQAMRDIQKLFEKAGTDREGMDIFKAILTNNAKISETLVGKKRKELPQAFKDILKEIKDPYRNYTMTMSNLAKLKMEDDIMEEVITVLSKQKGAMTTDALEAGSKGMVSLSDVGAQRLGRIFGRGAVEKNQVVNKFDDIYVTPAYRDTLEQGMGLLNPKMSDFFGILRGSQIAGGLLQTSKTVLSTATWGVNIAGNNILMLASGHMPISVKGFKQAAKSGGATMFGTHPKMKQWLGMSNKELADTQARYRELGLTGSDINVNLLRRYFRALDSDPKILQEMANWNGVGKTPIDLVKLGFKKATDFYQFQDDLYKIMHFHKTLDDISQFKKFEGLSKEQLERLAAQRTRDLMPNFNMLPNVIKQIGASPVIGAFPSFVAESVRIMKNLGKYTAYDLSEGIAKGDKSQIASAGKRLAGMTTVAAAPVYYQEYTKKVAGITDEQEQAIENRISPFDANNIRFYSPEGIKKYYVGEDGDIPRYGLEYFNYGRMDPFNFIRRPTTALHAMMQEGEYSQDKMNKTLMGVAEDVMSPFIGPSMLTDAFFKMQETASKNEDETIERGLENIVSTVWDIFKPTTLSYFEKRKQYEQQRQREGFEDSMPITEYGTMMAEDEYDLGSFMGTKMSMLDFSGTSSFGVNPSVKNYKQSGNTFYEALRKPSAYATAEGLDNIYEEAVESQKKARRNQQEIGAVVEDYEKIFGPQLGIKVLKDGISNFGLKGIDPTTEKLIDAYTMNKTVPLTLGIPPAQRRLRGVPEDAFEDKIKKIFYTFGDKVPLFDDK